MRTLYPSGTFRRSNGGSRLVITTIMGMVFGYFIGISSPNVSITKISLPSNLISSLAFGDDHRRPSIERFFPENLVTPQIYVPTNPRGAESLPPRIVVPESDFYLRRLWGEPSKDLIKKPKYLVTFTVGLNQKDNIDAAVQKFSEDFQILLFHYDGQTSEWDEFEWSKDAIHISVRKQTKWWYAKRFLHPDIVAANDYIFIWDEDLGVEHFNAEKYIRLVKRHGLEISQPGLEPNNRLTWQMTKRRDDREVHKNTDEKPGWCRNPRVPPCAAFVEIMAPMFSREAWRCVWHMIQPAHEKIGVVDSQWIVHQFIPFLGNQFSEDFQILLFHYDGQTSEWDEFEWSKDAIHISVRKQTKWWYAKRFLHPDIIAANDYIFIWDEDLGVEHFNAEKYIRLVKRHGLEISQPGLEPNSRLTWQMTKRRDDREVHKNTDEKPGWCRNPRVPPCAAFVEIMAPVFSREAWRCVWHMIQPAHEKIGIVDSQWIVHQFIPSLGNQGETENGKAPWEGVKKRCTNEWAMFQDRLANADKSYFVQHGKNRV